ncbi:MAG: toprim domain-containing protein [Clostridiales bacterium]|uniref:toprim domain-containing protein n=1 Tax=Terrisporobacter sp. TaxID=1965305 RepID=UPI002A4ECDD5|nr:toprim domain-containing protein [Terrisporobacter sp.]MDD7755668.1 toprim domain-containing protein [Clostridiales bacterium]MDY4134384.1 toprim domain-containing protein [Terrisporobacter sp.]
MVNYGINDIESLSFKDGVRQRIAMYLGSADMQGVYNAIQEIISNSIDEYYMGYGNEITIGLGPDNMVVVTDKGRGIPFGIKEDGSNVLVDIFSRAHTGGKFNDKVYNSVAGLNGIGAKATCLSSLKFNVCTVRDNKMAMASWEKGELVSYRELDNDTNAKYGTSIQFSPDPEVYNLEPINIDFNVLCEKCKNLSYLTKGLTFILETGKPRTNEYKKVVYCANNGLLDLINDNVKNPVHKNPIYFEMEDGNDKVEIALQWTKDKEKSFVFTNGLENIEGGTPLTGMKTALTTFMKKQFKGDFDGDMARTGLVYAVSCKTPNPSFANQTKTKINNPELRGLAQRATGQALQEFSIRKKNDFDQVIEFLTKERKAELAAERARRQILEATKDIEKNQKKKVFASDKLKDAEFLGENSTLLLVEGLSAASSVAMARDVTKYGILALRGKMLNLFTASEEKIYENEEIKLLLSAMNIIPDKYDSKKLRYGKIGILTDADADGYAIGLLIMCALYKIAPQFIEEGRLYWMRSPLYIVKSGKKESYYFTDEEFNSVRSKIKGEVTRAKGLGALSAEQAKKSMFSEEYQRLEQLIPDKDTLTLLSDLMGKDSKPKYDFIFENLDFSIIME